MMVNTLSDNELYIVVDSLSLHRISCYARI